MAHMIPTPNILTDPGYLFLAKPFTAMPAPEWVFRRGMRLFGDMPRAAWDMLGATERGTHIIDVNGKNKGRIEFAAANFTTELLRAARKENAFAWQSLDNTMRLYIPLTRPVYPLSISFKKAPHYSTILFVREFDEPIAWAASNHERSGKPESKIERYERELWAKEQELKETKRRHNYLANQLSQILNEPANRTYTLED